MNDEILAFCQEFNPQVFLSYVKKLRQDIFLLKAQLNHINLRLDEEVSQKLVWHESSDYWKSQAKFFEELWEETCNQNK